MKTTLMKSLSMIAIAGTAVALTSCVNEWPKPEYRLYEVTLRVHCDTDWLPDYEMNYTRESTEGLEIQYQFQLFEKGQSANPLKTFTIYSTDFSRADFTVDLSLYPGDYDVYVWSDICDAGTNQSLFYNSEDFAKVTYLTPYKGDSNNKDAFRGQHSFTIENTMYLNPTATEVVNLERPLARYIFVAQDLDTFVKKEQTRGHLTDVGSRDDNNAEDYDQRLEEELGSYTIKIIYPIFMPAVFDNYTNKPIDSWTGVSFDGSFQVMSASEAQLGLDYVMIGTDASSVQVALEVYDNEGVKISSTSTLNVPTLRDRTTYIYGDFLTTQEDAGVTIDPNFKGQFNILYK